MGAFKFVLGDKVKFTSGECGEVLGRAEYVHSENTYYVRYVSGTGCLTEAWWSESALQPTI